MSEDEERYSDTEQPEGDESLMDVATLTKELDDARQRAEDYLISWQRAQADFTNIRRRLEQDKAEAIKYAEGDLILKLLLVLDDLDRAMKHAPPDLKSDGWVQGMEGIARKFKGVLEGAGLEEIAAMGLAFDPTLHEAVACLPGPEGMVIAEHDKGYRFKDRVLRPSRVAVGSSEPAQEIIA
ncbi:MAG: nucleotide exchange factor GrpE [Dehalococcoidia bacterium]|nr:nucleotide exchange factor GrpE [Dehalococcoidia bacterium]